MNFVENPWPIKVTVGLTPVHISITAAQLLVADLRVQIAERKLVEEKAFYEEQIKRLQGECLASRKKPKKVKPWRERKP